MHWLEFLAYFCVILVFFGSVWMLTGRALDRLDEREKRKFEEKVDRYRR